MTDLLGLEKAVYIIALRSNPQMIIRAAEIAAGMWEHSLLPKTITKEVHKSKWSKDTQAEFEPNEHYKTAVLPVIAIDAYNLNSPFLVTMPNGEAEWLSIPAYGHKL